MLPSIGLPELVVILVLALIIFGPGKLPDVGKAVGKALNEFKRASKEVKESLTEEEKKEHEKKEA